MTSKITLSTALLLFSLGAAYAQDATDNSDAAEAPSETTEVETTGSDAAEPEAEAVADGDAAGGDAAGGEEEPREVIAAVHTDWQIRCTRDEQNCYMYQLAVDSRDVPVAEVSIVQVTQSQDLSAGVTVVTPLMTFLPPGLQFKIDEGEVQRHPYEFCAQQGCVARFGLTTADLDQFRRGSKALLSVTSAENRGNPIVLDLSLSGFTAAFADLSSR